MKEKFFKGSILVLVIMFLLVIIGNTYAKYLTSRDSKAQTRMAQWNIKLNNSDITEGLDFSELIDIQYDTNPNIASNVIVPTSSGYFIVNIESTGTEVPFTYELSMDVSDSAVDDFRITSYLLYDGSDYSNPLTAAELAELKSQIDDFVILDSSETTITGEVDPVANNGTVINSFLIYFGWYDGDDEILDNFNDVASSKAAHSTNPTGKGIIDLKLKVTQKDEILSNTISNTIVPSNTVNTVSP